MAQLSRREGFLAVAALAGVLVATATACESKSLRLLGNAGGGGGTGPTGVRDASTPDGKQAVADASVDPPDRFRCLRQWRSDRSVACNDQGVCQPGPTIICAPYGCEP